MKPERAGVLGNELIAERIARLDRVLIDTGHTVHRVRDTNAMPVDRRCLRESIVEIHDNGVAKLDPQFRSRHGAVVGPDLDIEAVGQLSRCRLGDEIELPDLARGDH